MFEDKIEKLQKEVGKLNQDNMRLERKCVTKDDEIYRLKKDFKTVSELLGKYQQENESLKQRIAELESEKKQLKHDIDKMAESKSEWIDRAVEWQQKCEKLESKKMEKPTKCTTVIVAKEINGQTYVTLDDFMSVVNDFQAEIGT